MPETSTEYLWWALNGAIAVVIFLARNDLKEIKNDIKAAQISTTRNDKAIAEMKAKCPRWQHYHQRATDPPPHDDEEC